MDGDSQFRTRRISNRTGLFTSIVLTLFLLFLTILATNWVRDEQEILAQKEFKNVSDRVTQGITTRIHEYTDILYAGLGLFTATDSVSRRDWQDFLNAQRVWERFAGVQAIEYVERVEGSQLRLFEEVVRADKSLSANGYPDFKVHPESDPANEHYIVKYVEPFLGNEAAFGFDLFTNDERRLAIEKARDTNDIVFSAPITLIQETQTQQGFLVFLPIYSDQKDVVDLGSKREKITGMVLAVFRADDFASSTIGELGLTHRIDIRIDDITEGHSSLAQVGAVLKESVDDLFQDQQNIYMGGREWLISMSGPKADFINQSEKALPQIILILGGLVSLLTGSMIYSYASSRNRAVSLARELTRDLEKFKLAVESATDGIVITNPDHEIVYVNNSWQKTTGYSKEEVLGENPRILQSGKTPRVVYEEMYNKLGQQEVYISEDFVNKKRDGSEYNVQLAIYPIVEDGKTIFYVGLEQDITKRKRVEKAKDEFVSLASHQLRTPLSAIGWYTEMLLSGDAGDISDIQRKYLNEVYSGNIRMVELVNALLDVSRIDLGTFAVEPTDLDANELAKSVVKELSQNVKEKNLTLKTFYGDGIPMLCNDPRLIRIIFQNLLSNSIKYTDDGGIVELTTMYKQAGDSFNGVKMVQDSLVIVVKDSGCGIPLDQQDKIFTKLFRADNVKETDTEGTGLGLYLVKSIVNYIAGHVWFESKLNGGTTFYAAIPIKVSGKLSSKVKKSHGG